jgi:YidC/Oxa1 family membrane protein insertase
VDRNLLLAFALSFLVLSLWSMLQEAPPPPEAIPEGVVGEESAQREDLPAATDSTADSRYPTFAAPRPAETARGAAPRAEAERVDDAVDAETIELDRGHYRAVLSSEGASLRDWQLLDYADKFGDPVQLLSREDPLAAASTPFPELGLGDLSRRIWRVDSKSDTEVRFSFERGGITVRKTYAFSDDGYDFTLLIDVSNQSDSAIGPAFLIEWPILERVGNDFREQSAVALADGELEATPLAGLGSAGFFGGFTGAKAGEPVDLVGEIDWAGVQTPYFLSAVFPDQPSAASSRFVSLDPGKLGTVQVFFAPVALPPGQQASRVFRTYLGPKEPKILEDFSPTALESIDLGFSFIAPMTRAFSWALAVLYSFIPNYGWAIIVLTILVRLVMAPLTMKQMKSMERMRKIQPKIKELQEKFADDRQKQSEAMMSLYRQEGVNPLGGCFPMLLQLPVFIGLFYALRSSIQLRQAPFIGWIDDLSAPDLLFMLPGLDFPVRILPLLMGASMFAQQKLTPMQMDPTQARMMLIMMPGMMLVISYTFPSGLVLYWMMSNVLAIVHQLWIGKRMEPAES